MDKIITLDDLVMRDKRESVKAWILWMCVEAIRAKKIEHGWDGKTVEGESVPAFVNNGRWLGRCKICGNPIYVSWKTPILYCMECGNGGSKSAWPVSFPHEREQIEAALIRRDVEFANPKKLIRNEVEMALNAHPTIPGLARAWRPGITVKMLEEENDKLMNPIPSHPQPIPPKRKN